MNSGQGAAEFPDRLSLVELQKMMPNLKILEEKPLTGPNNYVIVWGM